MMCGIDRFLCMYYILTTISFHIAWANGKRRNTLAEWTLLKSQNWAATKYRGTFSGHLILNVNGWDHLGPYSPGQLQVHRTWVCSDRSSPRDKILGAAPAGLVSLGIANWHPAQLK